MKISCYTPKVISDMSYVEFLNKIVFKLYKRAYTILIEIWTELQISRRIIELCLQFPILKCQILSLLQFVDLASARILNDEVVHKHLFEAFRSTTALFSRLRSRIEVITDLFENGSFFWFEFLEIVHRYAEDTSGKKSEEFLKNCLTYFAEGDKIQIREIWK